MTRSAQRRRRLRRKRRRQARRRQQTARVQPKPIIQTKRNARRRHRCPTCGKKGWRKRIKRRRVRHLAHKMAVFWIVVVGVYRATCACRKFFTSCVDGVAQRAGYTDAVRQKVVDLLVRDHLSVYKVQRHLREDFDLQVSVGFIYDCLAWAETQIDKAAHWAWALKNFSGVLCIDEVHDCGKTILVATDPLNDFTVSFRLVDRNDQRSMNTFLDHLKQQGLHVRVAITDGSALYKKALVERWEGLQHQLCVFHFLKDLTWDVLTAARTVRRGLPLNVSHRRGRPCKRGRPRKSARWRQDLLRKHAYLLVKKSKRLTRAERKTLRQLYELDPRLRTLRCFIEQVYRCFAGDISPQAARNRRTRLLRQARFRREPLLRKALGRLSKDDVFEKLLTHLSWYGVDRTSNHVERKNRSFRLVQKTRYKRRSPRRIEQAYWLHMSREWEHHPLQTDARVRPARIRRRSRRRRARRRLASAHASTTRRPVTPLRKVA